jgi:hypothetical protein
LKYIDFHVHAFNDKIAERAIQSLETTAGYKALSDGTLADTRVKYEYYGIDRAVILPIATKPSQQTVINNWAAEIQDSRFISFGSVHPDAEDVMEELERIKSLGLHGIKLHPDYMNIYVNDERMIKVFRKCSELNLPVVIHCGYDPYSPEKSYASPEMISEAFDKVPEMTLIAAHLGGVCMWDDAEKYLVGKQGNLYFDTGVLSIEFTGIKLGHNQFERIVKSHGADRILFASDFPWDNPLNEIEMIQSLDISDDEKEMIFYRNAVRLLGI